MRPATLFPALLALALAGTLPAVSSAWALSEIQREDLPAPDAKQKPAAPGDESPQPAGTAAPSENPSQAAPSNGAPDAGSGDTTDTPPDPNRPALSETGPLPAVSYDLAALPEPVRRMHDKLVEACKSADVEKLRPLLEKGEDGTQLSLTGVDGDPIEFLKQSSGDGQGLEILAILQELLEAGYVHLDAGKDSELYVWPYFFAIPLDRLTPKQMVELYKIETAGDVEEMKSYNAYLFYRVGITPEGRWEFFLAGE